MKTLKKPDWVINYDLLPDNQDSNTNNQGSNTNSQDSESDNQDSSIVNQNEFDNRDNNTDSQDKPDNQDSDTDNQNKSDNQNNTDNQNNIYSQNKPDRWNPINKKDADDIFTLITDNCNKLIYKQCNELSCTPYLTKKLIIDFYSMIERVGGTPDKDFITKPTDIIDYDINQLIGRKLSKKSLPQCKNYRMKEEVTVWLDDSGSCVRMTNLISNLSSILVKRHDVKLVINSNIYIGQKENSDYLVHSHPEGIYTVESLKDIITGKIVIIFSDSDWFLVRDTIYEFNPKRIIFFDAMSYYMVGYTNARNFMDKIIDYDDNRYLRCTPRGNSASAIRNRFYIPDKYFTTSYGYRCVVDMDDMSGTKNDEIKKEIISKIPMHRKISSIEDWYCAVTPNMFIKNLKIVK